MRFFFILNLFDYSGGAVMLEKKLSATLSQLQVFEFILSQTFRRNICIFSFLFKYTSYFHTNLRSYSKQQHAIQLVPIQERMLADPHNPSHQVSTDSSRVASIF